MPPREPSRPPFLAGGGELAGLIAAFPWETTALGSIAQWPGHVRHTVAMMLRSPVPMVALFDAPGVMIYNDAYSGFAGGRHPRLLGSPVREGWPEVAEFNDNVMRVGLAGRTLSYTDQELTLFRNGVPEQVWMNLDYSPVLDDAGRPAAVLAIVVETTAKVRAERQLAHERARMHQMFEQAPGIICTVAGPQHVFEFANAAFREMFGRELVGKTVREAFPELEGQGFFELMDEVYRTGIAHRADGMAARVRRPGGDFEQHYLNFVYQPLFDDAGAVTGVFFEGFEVTKTVQAHAELQRTQSWLQEGLDAARMVAFEWDLSTDRVRYSANSRDVLGYDSDRPSVGLGTMAAEDEQRLRSLMDEARATQGEYHLVHRRRRPDNGALMWTDTRGRVYAEANGGLVVRRGVIIDVTERVRSEEAMREASRRKDEFLAMLAHELRNPLAPIATGSVLLARSAGNVDVVRKTSELIGRQVRHMSELLEDLLDVSRVTRGLIHIEHAPVALHPAVQSALEQARPLIDSRHHSVTMQLPADELFVAGDRTRLVQVLVNLLTNAAKYTPPHGAIHIELVREGARAVLAVEDNGSGIEPDLLPHVFDLFTQGDRTPDRSQGGLGLGLALVKAIVDLHGGEVRAASGGKGQGSRFSVVLPLLAGEAVHAAAGAPSPPAPAGLRILLTDDNVDAAETLAALLRLDGHEVEVCFNGEQALAAADRQVPDVCILDVGLPDITGLELARRLRARPALRGTLMVALTGYGQATDRAATAEAGFDEHFVKPVEPAQLDALLAARRRR